jgi:hypothetical protein
MRQACPPLALLALLAGVLLAHPSTRAPLVAHAAPATYYVSSSAGSDSNSGTSASAPIASLAKASALALEPGDRLLLRCGDTWRGEMLEITRSGQAGSPISIGAYPEGCAERPRISGSLPIGGWSQHAANIFVADLRAGANAARFPLGVNQVFRADARLPIGRWPNPDNGDGGYTAIEAHAGAQIAANALPDVDWRGATAHIKGMRWYILNRSVVADSGDSLTLNSAISCYSGCVGWGFWLTDHLATLDREGEWFYDRATGRLYLHSASQPADGAVEASAIMKPGGNGQPDNRAWGGITLGRDLGEPAQHLVVERLEVKNWYRHGIATPTNHAGFEPNNLVIRDTLIRNVNDAGISLASWVFDPKDGRPAGWRGGYALGVLNNTIDGANRYGIVLYSRDSTFSGNSIRNISLIPNLGTSGMGCGIADGEGACTQDGTAILINRGQAGDTATANLFARNRLAEIGNNGFLIFGPANTLRENVIAGACRSKGDCAGVRIFGDEGNPANRVAHANLVEGNLISGTLGVTDGALARYRELFGFGINGDYVQDLTVRGNTVARSTTWGVLFKRSSGAIITNTLYDNAYASDVGRSQIVVGEGSVASLAGNIAFALNPGGRSVAIAGPASLAASDDNYFFHPFRADHLVIESVGRRTLEQWRADTGKDTRSKTNWYSQATSEASRSTLYVNDTASSQTIDLGPRAYLDLEQRPVLGSLTLAPFSSRVLVFSGEIPLAPGFALIAGPASPPAVFTLRNITGAPLAISGIDVSDGFERSSTCRATLAAGASCTISVGLAARSPLAPLGGTLTVSHSAGQPYSARLLGAPRTIFLALTARP